MIKALMFIRKYFSKRYFIPALCTLFLSTVLHAQTVLIDPSADGGFEQGVGLSANGWIAVNASTDGWYSGNTTLPGQASGDYAAYISSSGGSNWAYSQENTFLHLYKNFTVPVGQTVLEISFSWKAGGEGVGNNDWDNLKVFLVPATYTPTVSGAVPAVYQISGTGAVGGMYKLNTASYTRSDIQYTAVEGQTYRLVFSWKSDDTDISNPPAAIDNVNVTARASVMANGVPANFNITAVQSGSFQVNWTDNSTNETAFEVFRSFDNVNFLKVATIASSTTSFTGTNYSYIQNGAIAGDTYYYRITAMAESASVPLSGNFTMPGGNTTIYSTTSGGLWSQTTTWEGGVVPTASDNVNITDGSTVTIDQMNLECRSLEVGAGGNAVLQFAGATTNASLIVYNNVVVNENASFVSGNGTGTKTLHIGGVLQSSTAEGSLTVNGTFDMSLSATQFATVHFRGVQDAVIDGTGPVCNFNVIQVSKGENIITSNTSVLNVNRVISQQTPASAANFLQINAGTFKINSASMLHPYNGTQTIVQSSGALWLNNPGAEVSAVGVKTLIGTGGLTVAGWLIISDGKFEYGSGNNRLHFNQNVSKLSMHGGVLNAYGIITFNNAGTTMFEMTGGAINIDVQEADQATATAFSVGESTSVNWTGGVITIVDPHASASGLSFSMPFSTNKIITGGTLRIGDGVSGTPGAAGNGGGFGLSIGTTIHHLELNTRTDLSPTRMVRLASNSFVGGNILIHPNSYLFTGTGSIGYALVHYGPSFTNNGVLAGTEPGGTQSIGSVQFSSMTVNQSLSGTGQFIQNNSLNIATAGVFTFNQTEQYEVNRLNFFRGTIQQTHKLTVGLGGTSSPVIQRGGISTGPAPVFDGAPTFNPGTGGLALVYALASTPTVTGLEIPPSRTVASFAVLNPEGVLLNDGNLSAVALVLNADNPSLLTTSADNLLTVTGTISGATSTSYVNGPMQRVLPASLNGNENYLLPVGKSGYNPFELVQPKTSGAVTVFAEVFDAPTGGTPGVLLSSLSNTRYWNARIASGNNNLTETHIRLYDSTEAFDAISGSSTLNGTYLLVGGFPPQITAQSITSVAPAVSTLEGYFTMAVLARPFVTALNITPSSNLCVHAARTVEANVAMNGAPIAQVQLVYEVNGVPATPINMSLVAGNTWSAVIPTVTPSNATVTWKVVATDANNLTTEVSGTSYHDEAADAAVLNVAATPSTVCAGNTAVLNVEISGLTPDYCIPTFVDTDNNSGDFINNFSFADITNNNSGDAPTDYTYYDQLTAHVTAGNAYTITLEAGGTVALFQQQFRVWIDYNHDGIFSADESVFVTALPSYSPTVITGTIHIPLTAFNGLTRMRVVSEYLTAPEADEVCTIYTSWGEAEDYNVLITGGAIGPLSPAQYSWETTTGVVGTAGQVSVQPLTNTDYTVTVTFGNGCTKTSDVVSVATLPLPATPVNPVHSVQCGTGVPSVSVSGGANGNYRWYLVEQGGAALPGETSAQLQNYAVSLTTTFYVALTDGDCESERIAVTATVTDPDLVTVTASALSVCPGTDVILTAVQQGSTNNYTYTWQANPLAGSGLTGTESGSVITVQPVTSGEYVYSVTATDVSSGCTTGGAVTIEVMDGVQGVTVTSTPTTPCTNGTIQLHSDADFGTAAPVSIMMDFEDIELPFTGWTFLNNGSGNDWGLSNTPQSGAQALVYVYSETAAADVWAFAPAAYMKAGRTYQISFWYRVQSENFPEKLKVTVGNNNTVAAQTTVLWNNNGNADLNNTTYEQGIIQFTPTVSGVYYVGFNCYSDRNMFYLWLDNIAITGAGDADPVFAWTSVPAGFTSVVQNPSGVVVNNPTTYTVQITNAYGCSSSGSVTVSPNALPSEPNATHATHCGTMLSAASVTGTDPQGSGVFNWYDAPTGGVLLQSSVSQTYLTPISTSVTLYVNELSDAGCESARTPVHITVTEADPISVSASADSLCLNNTVTLTAQKTGNTNSYTYSWQASPGGHGLTGNETDEIINVTPQSSGLFTYEVTGTDILRNCVSTASVSVYVHALPEITRVAASPDSVCLGEPVTLTAGSEPDEIFGIVGTGTGTNTATTYPSAFGTYWGNARAQYLIRAAELLTGGLTAGYIQTIAFDVESVGAAAALNGYTIKLGTTTLDAMTVTINDPSVTVFGPVNYTPITGMNTLSLHTPFYWNGTDNLFVEICFNNGSAGGTNTLTKMTATDFASSAYTGNDNTSGNICFSNLTAASANRPNMQFSGTVIPDPTSNYLYTWQPLNMTGTQITVTPGASTVYSVTATDVQTGCVSATATASVYAAAPLTVSADITGPTGASGHVTGQPPAIYSVTAQNATAYVWDIPTGATNVSGQGTPSISFNYPAGYPGGTIGVTVYAQEPCAPVTRTLYITYDCPPAPQVDGIVNVCPYTNGTTELTYRVVNAVPTVIYQWSVPPNVHIVSGQGTDEIRITIDPTFIAQANQQIRVYGISACAQTPATIFYLRTQFPMTPQPITGLTEVCAYIETGNTVSYSISDVTAAENYVWTVPTGVTIVSGQGSTEISVVFEDDFETDYIRVRAENRCGGSPERSIKVFRNRPSAPGVISGPRNLCTMIPSGATGGTIQVVYSVTPQPGLTYNWSVPAGMAIINGQGTHSITTEVDDNYSGGNIEVFATGTCGSGSVRSLSLSTLRPGTPGNILQEVLQNCPGRLVRYYLENTPSNSNYLEWTVPVGATLMSGQGTTSVTVSYPETTVSGTVTVTARNGCGVSTTRKHNVSLEVCPPVPAPTLYVKGQPDNGKKHAMEISVYPNPFVHTFYLDILGANDQTPIYIQIVDELGRVRFEMQSVKTSGIPVSAGLKSGNYWITVRQEKNRATQKLVVLGE